MKLKLVGMLCRWVLAGTFLVACIHKIWVPEDFALTVFRYQLLPHSAINLVAIFLPWLELVTACALLFGHRFRQVGLVLIVMMLCVFTGGMVINIFRGVNIACGCFSADPEPAHLGWGNIIRNGVLLVIAGVALCETKKEVSSNNKLCKNA